MVRNKDGKAALPILITMEEEVIIQVTVVELNVEFKVLKTDERDITEGALT